MPDEAEFIPEGSPKLEVVLLANGNEVARSENSSIWLSAMAAMTGQSPKMASSGSSSFNESNEPEGQAPEGALTSFASDLGIEAALLEAAADPTEASPFIVLDHKYWEALKRTSGRANTPPVVLAGTFLLLWGRHAEVGEVTTKLCGRVLSPIGLTTKNAARSFKNCDWIQFRDGALKLNPAKISMAEELVKAYCLARD